MIPIKDEYINRSCMKISIGSLGLNAYNNEIFVCAEIKVECPYKLF